MWAQPQLTPGRWARNATLWANQQHDACLYVEPGAKPKPPETVYEETNMKLEEEFHTAMMTTYEEGAKRGYYPTYFMQMLHQYGGVETAKRLLAKHEIQTGLMKLYELGLLDSSMEAYVIKERYQPLFTHEECKEAHRRLKELGYFGKVS
jgi:hypothetical protein